MDFKKTVKVSRFLDPFDGFAPTERLSEVRSDPLTGHTCRILDFPVKELVRSNLEELVEKSRSGCPFCPDMIEIITPKFHPDLLRKERYQRGEALCFPNVFPYDENGAVTVMCREHYVALGDFSAEMLKNAIGCCIEYLGDLFCAQPDTVYQSVNWNYMPPAGGGLVHPHLQTILGEEPTRRVRALRDSALSYHGRTGHNLWKDFCVKERRMNERLIADTGSVIWLSSFAPGGMAGEVLFFFPGKTSLLSVSEGEIHEFLDGLSRVLSYFDSCNFISFNMAFYGTLKEDEHLWVQGRIMPRFLLPPLGTSDINYFEKIHDEIICPSLPEDLCREIGKLF